MNFLSKYGRLAVDTYIRTILYPDSFGIDIVMPGQVWDIANLQLAGWYQPYNGWYAPT